MHGSWKPNVKTLYIEINRSTEEVMRVFFYLSLCTLLGRKNKLQDRAINPIFGTLSNICSGPEADNHWQPSPRKSLYLLPQCLPEGSDLLQGSCPLPPGNF